MVGGPSGDQILTAPEFVRTRENMNEFGGCASAGKSIRTGLSQVIKQMSDPQMTGRLTGVLKKINLEDQTEARGYRAILISQEKQYLIGFPFDKNVSLEGVFTAPYSLSNTVALDAGILTVQLLTLPILSMHQLVLFTFVCWWLWIAFLTLLLMHKHEPMNQLMWPKMNFLMLPTLVTLI